MSNSEYSDIVFQLLYAALIDIRENALKTEDKVAYHLSDLFHNVPDLLKQVEKGEIEYSDILNFVEKKAEDRGIKDWVDNIISQIK